MRNVFFRLAFLIFGNLPENFLFNQHVGDAAVFDKHGKISLIVGADDIAVQFIKAGCGGQTGTKQKHAKTEDNPVIFFHFGIVLF